ncbi:MAG: hypothetical protein Q9164_005635 [Protoblastenia rupestris]
MKASKPADAVEASKRKKIHHVETGQIKEPITIQIIIGTYEKVLYGLTATISGLCSKDTTKALNVDFADTFMFNAHGSAIRCLAISPITHSSEKVILASGGSDQIVNLYSISTIPDSKLMDKAPPMPSLAGNKIKENPRNRELGSLQHHAGSINALQFPTRSKLLSAAEDNTVAVARTRDWTVLSTIKAPIPKVHGRPSGDTAPSDGVPAGVTHFAVHPSMKLMLSLGKGEKCMRLWNLVTGKKAAVLNFDRGLLQSIGEGKYSRGEGRRVEWNRLGEEFAVAFERGAVVYGIDSKPKCLIVPLPRTKIHQMHYVILKAGEDEVLDVLAISTEDGRILLHSTKHADTNNVTKPDTGPSIPLCKPFGVLGGPTASVAGRVKDFETLSIPHSTSLLFVTGSSDGAIRIWLIDAGELTPEMISLDGIVASRNGNGHGQADEAAAQTPKPRQVGHLLSTYEAGNRVTCLKAFVMNGRANPEFMKNDGAPSRRTNGVHEDADGEDR